MKGMAFFTVAAIIGVLSTAPAKAQNARTFVSAATGSDSNPELRQQQDRRECARPIGALPDPYQVTAFIWPHLRRHA
jgi:hypothetical protein